MILMIHVVPQLAAVSLDWCVQSCLMLPQRTKQSSNLSNLQSIATNFKPPCPKYKLLLNSASSNSSALFSTKLIYLLQGANFSRYQTSELTLHSLYGKNTEHTDTNFNSISQLLMQLDDIASWPAVFDRLKLLFMRQYAGSRALIDPTN